MLVSVHVLKKFWGVATVSLVHVGARWAHNAEEPEAYPNAGWNSVTQVEVQLDKVRQLATIIPSPLLSLGTHTEDHPEVVVESTIRLTTKTLASLISENNIPEILTLEIQGEELRAIKDFEQALGKA